VWRALYPALRLDAVCQCLASLDGLFQGADDLLLHRDVITSYRLSTSHSHIYVDDPITHSQEITSVIPIGSSTGNHQYPAALHYLLVSNWAVLFEASQTQSLCRIRHVEMWTDTVL
jgi:hypothetical protein